MSCCLCKLIKRYLYRCFDCCYKIETVDHKNYIGVYCSYTYCPSNYNLKDKSGINIKYRGHFYCNEQCLKMILNLIEQRINMDKSDIIVGVCHGEFGSNLFQNRLVA